MLRRRLSLVLALSVGDYALWTWATANDQQVVALISGVLLTALLLGLVWALALIAFRLAVGSARFGAVGPRLIGRARRWVAALVAARRGARTPSHGRSAGAVAAGRLGTAASPAPWAPDREAVRLPNLQKSRGGRRGSSGKRRRRGLAIPARIAAGGRSRRGAAARASASAQSSDRLAA